jgi:hypothetical protein
VSTAVYDRTRTDNVVLARLWQKGPMYQGSTEDEEGDEAVTEAVIGAEWDTVPIGPTVVGMSS